MPFIKGRFHINPIAGQALEAAREAEAALLALEHAAQQERQRQGDGDGDGNSDAESDASNSNNSAPNVPNAGPIHRVEIEASELVPSHQGRAVRGFVARVHREPALPSQGTASSQRGMPSRFGGSNVASRGDANGIPPETHVFADHRDLVSFLRDELAKDCK
jgi:hypothetical protein